PRVEDAQDERREREPRQTKRRGIRGDGSRLDHPALLSASRCSTRRIRRFGCACTHRGAVLHGTFHKRSSSQIGVAGCPCEGVVPEAGGRKTLGDRRRAWVIDSTW